METKMNIYELVTERIVAELAKGIIPWQIPWTGTADGAVSYATGRPYSFLNQMLLGRDGEWLTFQQALSAGGNVRKGEKGSIVVFWKKHTYEETKADGTKEEKTIPVLRYYNVWHISQCEGVQSKRGEVAPVVEPETLAEPETIISAYVEREKIKFQNDKPSNRAYYSPSTDAVVVPIISQYTEVAEYYSTAFHELVHSTGATGRLNRGLERNAAFGSKDYSKEELVAEIGSAMLCHKSGIDCNKAFRNSVAYIQSWLRALKDDAKMIVFASAQAEKASRYILGEQTED